MSDEKKPDGGALPPEYHEQPDEQPDEQRTTEQPAAEQPEQQTSGQQTSGQPGWHQPAGVPPYAGQPYAGQPYGYPAPYGAQPGPAPVRFRDRVLGMRGVIAVALASVILGGVGGAALGAVSSGDDENGGFGRGPGSFQPGQNGQLPPGGQQFQQGQVPGQLPPTTRDDDDSN